MTSAVADKTEAEHCKELEELNRQRRETTEQLRDHRGIRRRGLSAAGPRNFAAIGGGRLGFSRTRFRKEDVQFSGSDAYRPGRDDDQRVLGEVNTISGGMAAGGLSPASREKYVRAAQSPPPTRKPTSEDQREISFSDADLAGVHLPHDDGLAINMMIANYLVKRMLIDTGSSADILYMPTYEQIKIEGAELRPMERGLIGFSGDEVHTEGIVGLPVSIGNGDRRRNLYIDFIVVRNSCKVWNGIIGRITLNRLQAVISTYHQSMKFMTPKGLCTIRGEQHMFRQYYAASFGGGIQVGTCHTEVQIQEVKDESKKKRSSPVEELNTDETRPGKKIKIKLCTPHHIS